MTNDTTFGLRHGVLYEASPRALSPWASRINDQRPHDQNYGQFVMLTVPDDDGGYFAGQSWMIDTYHFDIPGVRVQTGETHNEAIVRQASERDFVSSWTIGHLKGNCYYNACVRLNEQNAGLFTEICDLREWTYVSDKDAPDYNEDDLRHSIHLYREHGYSIGHGDWGVTLLRKGAKKSPVRQAKAIVSKMGYERPRYDGWSYIRLAEELEKFAYEHRDDQRIVDILMSKEREVAFARRVADEWHDEFCSSFDCDQMRLFSYDDEGNIMIDEEQDED